MNKLFPIVLALLFFGLAEERAEVTYNSKLDKIEGVYSYESKNGRRYVYIYDLDSYWYKIQRSWNRQVSEIVDNGRWWIENDKLCMSLGNYDYTNDYKKPQPKTLCHEYDIVNDTLFLIDRGRKVNFLKISK